jgi:hypothetical protein
VTALLVSAPLSAQSVIGPAMSPPPSAAKPRDDGPTLRAVRSDLHPPVRFSVAPDSEKQSLRLYQERGVNAVFGPGGNRDTSEMLPLCSPPCEVSLRSRSYVFGVSTADRGAVKVEPVLQVRDGDQVVLKYNSHLPLRVVGWVLMFAGATAGGLLLASGTRAEAPAIAPRIIGGAVIMSVGLGFGLWFVNVPDSARGWVTR